MKINSIKLARNLEGKKVFLRSDFNLPIDRGRVKDDYKIIASKPTINFLIRNKCKIIIATHLGRPFKSGRINKKDFSAKIIANKLSKKINKKVKFVDDCIGEKVELEINKMKEGDILFLENLRFYKGEEGNDKKFAKLLAKLADIYVNDAFGVSHRKHASVSAIKRFLPSYAGFLVEDEVESLRKIIKPEKPLVAIIGGVKLKTKLALLKKLKKSADYILVGGAMANNFLSAKKYEVGKSLVSKDEIKLIKKIRSKKIILPIDVVVSTKKDGSGNIRIKNIEDVKKSDIIFDIGPKTINKYSKIIKEAKTIIWNGPMGKYEDNNFKHGTIAIARIIASQSTRKAFGVAGGGETVDALKETKMENYMDWVSTGGGAMLAFLGGEKMPGLKGIVK